MRMMDELKPLYLYSSNKKVYAPIDEKDKRRGSAILLLTPNIDFSSRLMNLPYMYNNKLFNSFYIDRNVMAYIDQVGEDVVNFDAEEEESLSEASLISWTKKSKIVFKDGTSMMDKRYIEEIFNHRNLVSWCRRLMLQKIPDEINIIVHPTSADLQKDAPNALMSLYNNRVFSYSKDNEIHLISKLSYDENSMCGPYNMYLTSELVYCLLTCYNSELHYIPCKSIGIALSGLVDWKNENEDHQIQKIDSIDKLSKVINSMIKKNQVKEITKYAKTGNIKVFTRYMMNTIASDLHKVIFESELSYFERQRLLPSDFGIPDKRKYPMPDEEHVRLAIKLFNHCDPDDEEELAKDIIKRIKRFGITNVKVSVSNRFYKYFVKAKEEGKIKTESVVLESFCNSDYEDVLKICSNLSKDEFNRISFYDTYRDSPFIIKRFIHRVGAEPAGFLDVYHFPSKKEIAQITIAVDPRFRGQGVANSLVREMLNANLPEKHGFTIYQWTAHPDNYASMSIAIKNGFNDTGSVDKYGRKIFILADDSSHRMWNSLRKEIIPASMDDYSVTESYMATNDFVLLNEANKAYSQRLKRYLYEERLRNSRAVLNIYDKIKSENPNIKRTYVNIKMYKKFNLFVDLSYYNGLFLKNNKLKLDRAVEFYFEFINRLINNKEIDTEYKMKTIFIPVDPDAWTSNPAEIDITDYRRSLNPISVIFRLARTNIALLKREWGNKKIIFVGSRGYFTIDFNKFEFKDINRVRINLRKLMSVNEVIKDDFERDELGEDEDASSSRAITANVVSKIEKGTGIKIDNISSTLPNTVNTDGIASSHEHLKISSNKIAINKNLISEDNGVAIISIDPDGPDGFGRLQGSLLSMASKINNYCIPEN